MCPYFFFGHKTHPLLSLSLSLSLSYPILKQTKNKKGGLGINLYTADVVVLYDSDWNPQMDLQAMDRTHRIGQKKEVQVFRFCVEHSIEEKVIEKAYKKLRLDALVIQQGRLTENTKTVNKEDLLSMVRYGAEMVFSSEAASLTDEDIDAIIKKGERATEDLNQKMQQFADGAMKFTLDGYELLFSGLSRLFSSTEKKLSKNFSKKNQTITAASTTSTSTRTVRRAATAPARARTARP